MDNAEVFRKIRERGAVRAFVEFSGGNDEGGAESIALHDGEGREVGKVEGGNPGGYWDPEKRRFVEVALTPEQRAEAEFAQALEGPVYEEYGTFSGDFSVSGRVTWDAEKGTVKMSGEESQYVPFEKEL
jgi:hypothetical protein